MKPKTDKSKGGRPRNTAKDELTSAWGVGRKQVERILKEFGADKITDIGELRLIEKKIVIALRSTQARREEHDLEIAKESVLPKTEVFKLGMALGQIVERTFFDFCQFAPSNLSGRGEMEIYQWLRSASADSINKFRTEVAKLDDSKNK